jgi:hypothetical protein
LIAAFVNESANALAQRIHSVSNKVEMIGGEVPDRLGNGRCDALTDRSVKSSDKPAKVDSSGWRRFPVVRDEPTPIGDRRRADHIGRRLAGRRQSPDVDPGR